MRLFRAKQNVAAGKERHHSKYQRKDRDGSAVEHWVLLVPVDEFETVVEGVEELGDVKTWNVDGVGAGAKGKRDPKALARVTVTIGQVSPLMAAKKSTFRNTAASAFKTLGYILAALLWGLIVLVPIALSLALVLKLVLRIVKPTPAAAVATAGANAQSQETPKTE